MITKQYLLEQIERVEDIIKNARNDIKITHYCTVEELKNLRILKDSVNYKRYNEECSKYDISSINYKYFKNSYTYKNFKKDLLLNYLEDIIHKAYVLELLDSEFTY